MPGTIGTYTDSSGREVRAIATERTVHVLVDNDGHDPFGGRFVRQGVPEHSVAAPAAAPASDRVPPAVAPASA